MKIVINRRYGGFGLSDLGRAEYKRRSGVEFDGWGIDRTDAILVQMVEEGGFDGRSSTLGVVDVPEDVDWVLEEYDGQEWIAERHRTWH